MQASAGGILFISADRILPSFNSGHYFVAGTLTDFTGTVPLMQVIKRHSRIKTVLRWVAWVLLTQFVLINISAALHAYRATHLYAQPVSGNEDLSSSGFFTRTWLLFAGVKMYRSVNTEKPTRHYDSISIPIDKKIILNGWWMKPDSAAKGTVILFHGLAGSKADLLPQATEFLHWGYNVLMIDARSHGASTGNYTTVGYREAADVRAAFDFVLHTGEKRIFLWGGSMGAVSIAKAIADYQLQPAGIILEMPFASLQSYLNNRTRAMGLPPRPFASLVNFWIGAEQGIRAFGFDIVNYAAEIHCPVLLQCGDRDFLVPETDIHAIYDALPGHRKRLVLYKHSNHEFLLTKDPVLWERELADFLTANTPGQ